MITFITLSWFKVFKLKSRQAKKEILKIALIADILLAALAVIIYFI